MAIITGTNGDDTIYGLVGDDIIDAGAGNDLLSGGVGNDTLFGGAGSDTFVFRGNPLLSLLSTMGIDTIADFSVGIDKVQLSKSYFSALATTAGNTLSTIDFSTVTTDIAAATANSGIVYNSSNGKLFDNLDGSAAGFGTNGGQFAQMTAGLGLSASNFTTSV
jgi:Ca2+-binding RTX toxin-like protein